VTLTPSPELDALLASIPVNDWDKALLEQAVYLYGEGGQPFSMNDLRGMLPELAHGAAGRVLRGMRLRKPAPIREVAQVRSTSGPTHGKPISVYVLTPHGHQELRARREQQTQRRAA
jgi:hypothetical protein